MRLPLALMHGLTSSAHRSKTQMNCTRARVPKTLRKSVLIRGRVRHLDEAAQSVRVGFRPDLHRYGIIVATHHRDRCRYHHRPKRIPNSLHPTRVGEIPERLLKKAQRHRFVLGLDPLVLRYPSHVANNPVRWALPDIGVRSNPP